MYCIYNIYQMLNENRLKINPYLQNPAKFNEIHTGEHIYMFILYIIQK